MNFVEHLRQFFGDEVADDELKNLAVHAIANDVRKLKPAISQAVWDSRQRSAMAGGDSHGVEQLNQARALHSMYCKALEEFSQITELQKQQPAEAVAGHNESHDSLGRTEDDSDSTREHR
jgi:hypothetical protein